jgi:phospholipid/cholesterol/gamma-HCH transport system substrate-binding protein
MKANRELLSVATFVAIAVGILLFTMLYIAGVFRGNGHLYRAYFKNAGGLQEGGQVRYAGGPPIGRVTKVEPDPENPTQMRVEFRVEPQIPVKKDSLVKIAAVSELADNYIAILPGSPSAPRATDGDILAVGKFNTFDDMQTRLSNLVPNAQTMVNQLTAEADKLQKTIGHLNDKLGPQNREKISRTIANSNNMLASTRRTMSTTLGRADTSIAKLDRSLDEFKKSLKKIDDAVSHLDMTIAKKDPTILASLQKLHEQLEAASAIIDQFDRKLSSTDVDGLVENIRQLSENLRGLTEAIKTRPNILLRSPEPKPRKVGQATPK